MFGAAQPDCETSAKPLGIDGERVVPGGSAQHLYATGATDLLACFFRLLISTREWLPHSHAAPTIHRAAFQLMCGRPSCGFPLPAGLAKKAAQLGGLPNSRPMGRKLSHTERFPLPLAAIGHEADP